MPGWFNSTRAILIALAALLMIGGVAIVGTGGPDLGGGVWSLVLGAGLFIVVVLERTRYRSESAEQRRDDPGPGGGERDLVEPRFRPTDEVFRDPTTGRLMRVYIDPRTGERRYLAEA